MASRKVTNPGSRRTRNIGGASGLPVDAGGNPTVDPTENVISLVEAANLRQDDLRKASDKLNSAEIRHIKEIVTLKAKYEALLREAEQSRINAIRAVDVNAVAISGERSAAQAQVLANQVSSSAETQRNLVNQTAANIAEQQRQSNEQFNARISAVERAQYEGQGKGSVQDPQMETLISQMNKLTQTSNTSQGKSAGALQLWVIIIGLVSVLSMVVGIILNLQK